MQKEVIIIGHPEKEYVLRLSGYLNEHDLLPVETVAFSERGKLSRFIKGTPVLALLIPPQWKEAIEKKEFRKKILYLTEEDEVSEIGFAKEKAEDRKKENDKTEEEKATEKTADEITAEEKGEECKICRYQPADVIAGKICEALGIFPGKKRTFSEKTKLIGVYSPVGRCLKTSFSLTLGQMLAARYRVLYLNFENYSGFGKILGYSRPVDMADLLYYFLNLSDEFSGKMEEVMMHIGGMDIIPPALSFLDLESIPESEWEVFLSTLMERGNYDYIILDLSDYVKGLYDILSRCSYIYTMIPNDGVAMAKIEQYELLLSSLHYSEILDRTRKVSPPVFRKLPIHPEELIHSELAEYTKKVTEDDFHWNSGHDKRI